MSEINILTVNVQGLFTAEKRSDIFNYLKTKNCQIYCLQDMHCINNLENAIRSEWGSNCLFSSWKSNARGIGILFAKDIDYTVHSHTSDPGGNYIIVDLTIDNRRITLVSLYAPNQDTPSFFTNIMSIVDNYNNEDLIICGDFNLVQNTELDYYNYKHINNKNAREKLLEIKSCYNLIDPYREFFPSSKRFTWRKRSPVQLARLDFFLISESLLSSIMNCSIEPSYRSDHSMVILKCKFNKFVKSKGLWKFNNSLLKDMDYLNTINQKIKEIKLQYALPVYNLNNLDNILNEDIQFTINNQLFLETLLMEIRGKTISYASFKKKQNDGREKQIINEISILEENETENIHLIDNLKNELLSLRKIKMEGCLTLYSI